MPTMNSRGKGILSTILSCSQGSLAVGTDGTMKILNGDSNEWINYNTSTSSNGGSSGSGGTIDESNIATKEEVNSVLDGILGSN